MKKQLFLKSLLIAIGLLVTSLTTQMWASNEYGKRYLYFNGVNNTNFFNDGATPYISPNWAADCTNGNNNGGNKQMTQIGTSYAYYLDLYNSSASSYTSFRAFYIGRSSAFWNGGCMGFPDGTTYNCIWARGNADLGNYDWGYYAVPITSISLAGSGSAIMSGAGTEGNPYRILVGDEITLTATPSFTPADNTMTLCANFGISPASSPTTETNTGTYTVASTSKVELKCIGRNKYGNVYSADVTSTSVWVQGVTSYTLTYSIGDVAGNDGSISSSPSTSSGSPVQSGNTVTLTAPNAATGYTWKGWYANSDGSGDQLEDDKAYAITMEGNTTVYACYTENSYSTTVAVSPAGSGSTTPSAATQYIKHHTGNSITATPGSDFIFGHWTVANGGLTMVSSSTTNPNTFKATSASGTITAVFDDKWAIAGIAESGTTADWSNFRGLPNTGTNTYSKTYTLAEGTYSFKVVDRKSNTWYTDASATVNRANNSKTADDEGGTGNHMSLVVDLAGDYTFTFNSSSKLLTVTYPTYTEALTSMSVAKGSYVLGGDGSTSGNTMKIYNSMVSSANFTMTVSPTSSSQGGTIKYAIGSTEKGTVTSPQSIGASTIGLTASPVQYTFKAYFKKGTYKSTGAEQTVSYYIQKTTDPAVTLATQISSANASDADLATEPTISLVASVTNNLVALGSNFTYYVKTPGSADWAIVASSAGNSTTYTPDAIGEYKFKVKWTHQTDWESDEVSFVVWKNYTIYVWDPDNWAKYVHIWKGGVSKYTWGNASEAMTPLSATWGTGWYSFNIEYPKWTDFKVHLDNATSLAQSQSVTYTFTQEPLVENNNVYFRCTNKSDANWLLSSIEEPQMPSITITSVNIYATKMVIDVAYDNHYSLLTASSLTVDGVAKDISGSVTNVGGGTYRCTLTNLDENTDYTFRASATNALGTATETSVITTLAKMPITMTIKVSSNLMANAANMWGNNGKTTVKIKYWNDNANFDGIAELDQIRTSGGYAWYKYTIEDSPVNFYIFNANYADGSGSDRSANWNNQSSDGCAEVYDDVTQDAYKNHVIGSPAMCGVHYKLAYYNGSTTIESNAIGDASDKMSLYINAYNGGSPAGRSLKLYKFDADWDSGTEIFSTVNPTESAVYVVSLKEGEDFETATSASKWDFEKYTGNYYIRTDHAPGGRNNYRGNSNKMTYSDYAAKATGSTFDHYFCKWVQGASDDQRNVSFTVANDYSDNLLGGSNMYVSDDYATGSGYLKQNASVRFMYDSRRNDLSRAYLSGSSRESDYFLVLRGDHSSSNHLWKDAEKTSEHTTNGTTDWAFFKDNNNWVYQVDVYAVPGTRIKLTARMKDKNNANKDQSFKGDASNDSFGEDYTDLLIGGTTSETAYPMRIIYDFKTNRLMTAWLPSELSTDLGINADVMLIRNGQGDAQHITLNNHQLTDVHTVYAVMQFNRWRLNNRANPETMTVESCAREDGTDNWVYDETVTNTNHPAIAEGASGWLSRYERDLYWISFPFDVNLNEVFGSVGTYGTHWIIEYYDGKGRAKNGFWADSPSNWKFINNVNTTLKANVGYILALDLDYFAYNNTTTWANNIHQVELYFPSMVSVETIKQDDVVVHIDTVGYQCTINRGTADGDRRIKDSHWHCIGVPSFANTTHGTNTGWTTGEGTKDDEVDAGDYPSRTDWTSPGLPYLYEWVPSDNSLKPINSSSTTFEAMYSYLVQYNKDTIKWMQVAAPAVSAPASIAARQLDTDVRDFEYCLKLNKDSIIQDQTFVRFTDDANVTNGFEFNYDLCKEQNGGKGNIWTVTTDVIPVAGNSMPKPVQTTVVPVGVKVVANGEYTLAMPEGTNGEDVYLIDNAYGTRTNLGLMPYTVTLTAGTYDSRFALEFGPIQDAPTGIEQMSTVNYQLSTEEVRKVFVGGRLYIIRDGKVYDAAGQRVE